MFLRWKKRRKQGWRWEEVAHHVSLVESLRIKGAVRQKYVAYVGSLISTRGQFSSWAISRFWKEAEERFDTLALSLEQRVRLRAVITQQIGPCPSEAELQQDLRQSLAELPGSASLSLLLGGEEKEGEKEG
jgi:hypothetical protein